MHAPSSRVRARRREIGTRIRDTRIHHNLSQERLSELAGISRQTIYRIELGQRSAQLDWLIAIADALKVRLSYLVREDDEAPVAQATGAAGEWSDWQPSGHSQQSSPEGIHVRDEHP